MNQAKSARQKEALSAPKVGSACVVEADDWLAAAAANQAVRERTGATGNAFASAESLVKEAKRQAVDDDDEFAIEPKRARVDEEDADEPAAAAAVSVVVPTYNETLNLRPLTERLFKATRAAALDVDLLFADDESHEPEAVPAVCAPVLDGAADFAIGSRNTGDGGIGFEWSLLRRLISKGATLLAYPLTASTDPMSGFFCVRKQTLARGDPNPIGFKIALEIMVRCGCSSVVDVPITFRERTAGESKLSPKQNVEYLQQLASLYLFAYRKTLLALAVAGAALLVALYRALFP
ncbi:dolichyl-phosphate beta-D-mannosyltransferase [Aureococcus anophagefferens]|nr:dolichyl-phosphate beta-D-mannosyltransferase [Aureococcus anophagefferens]